MADPLTPREAVAGDGALFAALRRARRKAAPGLQREHRRLLAESDRVRCSKYLTADHLTIYPEYQDARRDLRRILRRLARGIHHHQRHRRSNPAADQHLRRRWRRRAAAQAFLRDVSFLRGSGRRVGSRSGIRPAICSFPVDELAGRACGPETRAILIANPNNPTGSAIGLDQIELILETAPDAAVLIDEAYFEFCGVTALRWISEYRICSSAGHSRKSMAWPPCAAAACFPAPRMSPGFAKRNRLIA